MSARALIVTFGLALGAVACGRPWLPVATPVDATRAQARWPDVTVDELNHGRTLLVRRCGSCHQPPSPGDHTAAEWPTEVAEMATRSGLRAGEGELLTRYLTAFASDQVSRR